MSKVIGIVSEGPTDYLVLKAAIDTIAGEPNRYLSLQPELDMTERMVSRLRKNRMLEIVEFTREYVDKVIEYEKKLRKEEPDTYFWEPDEEYRNKLIGSFSDERFVNAVSFLAVEGEDVIGRIDASIVSSRADAECYAAYLDWICVLKSKRHMQVAQMLLKRLREELKHRGTSLLIALMARNEESQRFYRSVENAEIHDEGIWMYM